MAKQKMSTYGSWKSPITADLIASGTMRLEQIALDGEDVYWLETRPSEGGRYALMRLSIDGQIREITPSPLNVRTRVHEYGGGSFVAGNGTIYFSNFVDQRLYCLKGNEVRTVTSEGDLRYADGVLDFRRNKMICVCEDHSPTENEAINTLTAIDLQNGIRKIIVEGNDFYSSPCLSPDGSKLAWLSWNHPNMPWNGTRLWMGELNSEGSLIASEQIAGGTDESIFQPEWSPGGVLHFISDRNGWWNLYRWTDERVEPMVEMEAELGRPQWVFGNPTYAFESPGRIIISYTEKGSWHLSCLDAKTLNVKPIETPYTDIAYLEASAGKAFFVGGSPTEPLSLIRLDLFTGQSEVIRSSSNAAIDAGYLSIPQAIEFPTNHGLTAHAFYYAPFNQDYFLPPSEKPPMIVITHGGPTASTSSTFNLAIQYWTSRGIAVLDVNYGGSTGYGRAYRERLRGHWGIVDVDDCVNGAQFLVNRGDVDHNRLIIRGGSAGGFTTLSALVFRKIFRAGASYYGVCDLESLRADTHKFESHYLDNLIGPYPECGELFKQRSPINFTSRLTCPVIFFQGSEDRIVPPNQSEAMFKALRAKHIPTALLLFKDEQHGFRRAENIKRSLEAEFYFYSQVFGFESYDLIEPIPMENE